MDVISTNDGPSNVLSHRGFLSILSEPEKGAKAPSSLWKI